MFTAAFAAIINCWWSGIENTPPPDIAITAILNLTGAPHAFHAAYPYAAPFGRDACKSAVLPICGYT